MSDLMMSDAHSQFTKNLRTNPGARVSEVRRVLTNLGVSAPDDYVNFLTRSNGAEGPVGDVGYVVVWPIDQLVEQNGAYHVSEFAPSLVLFGSDGGDVAYAFDKRVAGRIVAVPFVGMRDDTVEARGDSLAEFLESVAAG